MVLSAGQVFADDWIGIAPINSQREGLCAVALMGDIYVIGGSANPGIVYATVEKYLQSIDQWVEIAPLNHPRTFAAAAVVDNKIFVFGGRENSATMVTAVEMFDPLAGYWQDVTDMDYPREGLSAVTKDDKIWLIGGYSPTLGYSNMVEVFDPANYEISLNIIPAIYPSRAGHGAVVTGGEVRILGGINYQILNNHTVWQDSNWVESPYSLPVPRFNLRVGITGDSMIVTGGFDGESPINLVECFDFAANQWTTIQPMLYNRSGHALAVLNDTVYVIGGFGGYVADHGYLASGEMLIRSVNVVDPRKNTVDGYRLNCYPNPFNSRLTIDLNQDNTLSEIESVRLFNSLGEMVFSWGEQEIIFSGNRLFWNGNTLQGVFAPSGVYFVNIFGKELNSSTKVILLK